MIGQRMSKGFPLPVTEIQINLLNLPTEDTKKTRAGKAFKVVCMTEQGSSAESSQSPREITQKEKFHS